METASVPLSETSGATSAAFASRQRARRESLQILLTDLLPTNSAFTWEVGCGHGHFLTAYATAHPEKICVGIDIMSERIARAKRKRDRAKLSNLHFVHAEARLFLESLPPGIAFSELFILFPDPWPKVRHHKHRILNPPFLTAAARRAMTGARLCFRTDFDAYFASAVRTIRAHHDWTVSAEAWPFEYSTVFQSRAPAFQSVIARKQAKPEDS